MQWNRSGLQYLLWVVLFSIHVIGSYLLWVIVFSIHVIGSSVLILMLLFFLSILVFPSVCTTMSRIYYVHKRLSFLHLCDTSMTRLCYVVILKDKLSHTLHNWFIHDYQPLHSVLSHMGKSGMLMSVYVANN